MLVRVGADELQQAEDALDRLREAFDDVVRAAAREGADAVLERLNVADDGLRVTLDYDVSVRWSASQR